MDELIKRLQTEVGLSEDEAIATISIIKKYMEEEHLEIDWERFFKGKSQDFTDKAKKLYSEMTKKTREYSDKIEDSVEDITLKAKRTVRDLTRKAADYLDDKID